MHNVIIVGGGASGMMATLIAARNGNRVILYEKNEKLGKKLFITGKGRCNVTNAASMEEVFSNIVSNPKFLYSAFHQFSNYDVMDLLEELHCKLKIERGNRVFPVSDHSSDVISALSGELKKLGVEVILNKKIDRIIQENNVVKGVETEDGICDYAENVIIATGGMSYQATGSTGDGYRFAREAGHTIKALSPALVPIQIEEDIVKELQGLSLKNVNVTILNNNKCLYSEFGEMLFTHYGVSGPLILSASSFLTEEMLKKKLKLVIDLKPALSNEQLDVRLLRDFDKSINKQFKNVLSGLLPTKLIPVVLQLTTINPEKKVNEIKKEERLEFVHLLKNLTFTISRLRDFNEAIITKGGVNVKEINPTTMESKIIKGLYFIGEVLDVDALTGGFNLQIAWSTAYAAGNTIFREE